MSSQGPNAFGSATDVGGGAFSWLGTSNALASDNTYASASAALHDVSNFLSFTNPGFSVPSGATIDGVLVEIEVKKSGSVATNSIKLEVSGGVIGSDLSDGAAWPGSDAFLSYGGSSSGWGASLTRTIVNDSSFGFRIQADVGSAGVASVDSARITVYYTPPASYVLSAASGAYTLTGSSVTLKATRTMAVSGGTYTLTGTAVVLTRGHPITVSAGAYTLAGSVVNLVAPIRLTADAGAYTLTGGPVALEWGHKVTVAAGAYTFTGSPAFPISVTTEETGACGIQGNFTSDCSGAFRLANDIDGYNLYIGEDDLPDFDVSPAAFSQALPVSFAITPPGAGTKTLYVAVRKQDEYGLESRNQKTTRFRIDTAGDLVRLPLSLVLGPQLAERQGGYVRLLATYPAFSGEDDPPSHWKVWAGSVEPDIGVDPVTLQFTMSEVLACQVRPFSLGVVYVKVVAWRNVDSAISPVASATLTLTATPSRPAAVHGGYDEP